MEILDAFDEGEFDDYSALVGNEEKNDTVFELKGRNSWNTERTVEDDEFALHNSLAINIIYRNYITQEILYSDEFSFWSLLTEVGGALGLYFGVTVITLYETFFFFFTVKEVKPIREMALDKKLTKRILYFKEANAEDSAQLPVPLHL
uniref:Sodium channel protein Nach n=2 Tax=Bursaphelenchus xylophilus TaxID=6326 RepID=A0A1I7S8A2_BURXY